MKYLHDSRFLIAGSNYLSLYDRGEKRILHEKGGVYYGISWSENRLFVLWRNFKKGAIILVFDTSFNLIDQIDLGKHIDGHQILYVRDRLFVTNTAENDVMEIDPQDRQIRNLKLSPFEHDHNHINGLSYIDEDQLWVLFANGKIEGNSEMKKYQLSRGEIVDEVSVGNQIHNFLGDYITSSYDFEVFRYRNGQKCESIGLKGWLRGMDFVDDLLLVGSSVISEREDRTNKNDGKLYLLDKSLNLLDEIKIPEIGQINEIRTISTSYSHNNVSFEGAEFY